MSHETSPAAATERVVSTLAHDHPQSAVGVCCRNSAMMLALADEGGRTRAELASFRELNKKQAELLNLAADLADEMLAALYRAESAITSHNLSRAHEGLECPWDFGEGFGGCLDMIRAAIAKAAGSRTESPINTAERG